MAKALRHAPPSSSLSRLLDPQAAGRAIASLDHHDVRLATPTDTAREALPDQARDELLVKRELTLTRSTDEVFTGLIHTYRRSTGTRITASHVFRAMLRGVAFCLPELEREASRIGRVKLPSNARGREAERDRFEDRIAEAFVNGVRSAAQYRTRQR